MAFHQLYQMFSGSVKSPYDVNPISDPGLSSPLGLIAHEGHTHHVESIAFSPDGKYIVSGSLDGTVRFWDSMASSSRAKQGNTLTDAISSVSYSPLGDIVASGSRDCTVRLWDTETGQGVGEILQGHDREVKSVAFSPSAKIIASGSKDRTIRLWDVRTRESKSSPLKHHSCVRAVAFSSDGAQLVSGSSDQSIRVWDIELGKIVLNPDSGHSSYINSVAFTTNGSQIVSGSADTTLRLWDMRDGMKVGKSYTGHTSAVFSVAFSPNGIYVASGSWDRTVRIWDVRMGRQVDEPFKHHCGAVNSVAFSPCGKRIASGSDDNTVMIWCTPGIDMGVDIGPPNTRLDNNTNNQGSKDDNTETPSPHKSIQSMFDRLSLSAPANLTSQIDAKLDAAILMFGGNVGNTWKGQLYNGTRIQIKVWQTSLIEQCSEEMLERTIKDIQTWSQMKHKNIHALMGVTLPRGQYLGLITERMENGNLHEYMRKSPQFDRHQMCTQVATGLAYIHQSNMVHGDLKAINVLISSGGVAKLSNFSLSALSMANLPFSEPNNSQTGALRWAAPELLSVKAPKTKESDMYALGMTMLEIMTGNVPYPECEWDFQVMSQVMQGELPVRPVGLKNDESGNQMWELLMSCWNKSPASRPSAKEVIIFLAMTITE